MKNVILVETTGTGNLAAIQAFRWEGGRFSRGSNLSKVGVFILVSGWRRDEFGHLVKVTAATSLAQTRRVPGIIYHLGTDVLPRARRRGGDHANRGRYTQPEDSRDWAQRVKWTAAMRCTRVHGRDPWSIISRPARRVR